MHHYKQWHERDYVIFMNVESDAKHTSLDAIHVTYHVPNIGKSFGSKVQPTSLHCSYVELHRFYKLKRAAAYLTLKRSIFT